MRQFPFALPLLHPLLSELEAIRDLLYAIVTERESGDYGRLYSRSVDGRVDYSPATLMLTQSKLRELLGGVIKEHEIYLVALSSVKEYSEWRRWITRAGRDTMTIDPADTDKDHPVGSELTQALLRTGLWIRQITERQPDPRSVFVVFGRNRKARDAMSDFLRAIDLRPVEWNEAVALTHDASPFIGEVLEAAFSAAQAVIVILTGDDLAQLRPALVRKNDLNYEREPTPQARPNVLFEAGFAFASHPKRTILVEFGRLRPFSDVQGKHVIHMDNSPARRQDLAERLRNAGCPVSLSGNDWHHAGAFGRLK
jgi:predicted nucleotide-binding protein